MIGDDVNLKSDMKNVCIEYKIFPEENHIFKHTFSNSKNFIIRDVHLADVTNLYTNNQRSDSGSGQFKFHLSF